MLGGRWLNAVDCVLAISPGCSCGGAVGALDFFLFIGAMSVRDYTVCFATVPCHFVLVPVLGRG